MDEKINVIDDKDVEQEFEVEENFVIGEKIMIVADDGVEKEFEVVDCFLIQEKTYVLLSENEESDDVFPFVVTEDEEGEYKVLMAVEDEAEFALIEAAYDEEYDEEEDEEGEGETE